jgi:hypothetical protein
VKLRRGGGLRFGLRLLMLILLSTPFEYNRAFLPGLSGETSDSSDQGWVQYCTRCEYIGPRYTSQLLDGALCDKKHSTTIVLFSYVCQQCKKEILYRPMMAPRLPRDIQCQAGTHTPKEILAREPGTGISVTILGA